MMKRLIASLFILAAIAVAPARAQFADQGTVITSPAGSANAQTGTVANATSYSDLTGVLLKYTPAATNTSAATLSLSGLGGVLSGGPIAFEKPNGTGLTALTGLELATGQPILIMFDGTSFDLMGPVLLPSTAANLGNSSLGFDMPKNLTITPSVGSNQLTITLTGNNGSALSASNPLILAFRDVTIVNGDPAIVTVTAPLSFTIGSGDTMGCVSGQACRLRLYAINNGGTVGLCAYNSLSGTNIVGINEQNLQTSQSGTAGGSSAQLLYCNLSAVTAKAVREIGYVNVTETTAGTWASLPTYTQLMGPGVKKAGDVVQGPLEFVDSTTVTCSTTVNTPTDTAQSIVPTSAANVIYIHASESVEAFGNTNPQVIAQVSRGSGPTLIGNVGSWKAINGGSVVNTGVVGTTLPLEASDLPNSTSRQTYTVYVQASVSNGCHSNPSTLGTSAITVWEIESALEGRIPANDNEAVLRMVG